MAPAKKQKQQEQDQQDQFVTASSVKPEKVEWLWRNRIPKGALSVVAGRPDQGKGLFTARVAADVSRSRKNVIYSAVEDAHSFMTRPRLEAAGANLDRVFLGRFVLPRDFATLREQVIEKNIALVVIDPFNAHLMGVSRFSDSVRVVTTALSDLAEQTGAAILVTEHVRKKVSKNEAPLNAIGGNSSGLPAAARMGFLLGTDPEDGDRRILANVKHNVREKAKALAFEVDVDEFEIVGTVASLMVDKELDSFNDLDLVITEKGEPGTPGPKPDKRAAAAEWLATYLMAAGKPVRAGQIKEDAVQIGMHSAKTIRRAADDMGVIRSAKGGPNVTWDLPEDVKKLMGGGQ